MCIIGSTLYHREREKQEEDEFWAKQAYVYTRGKHVGIWPIREATNTRRA